MANRKWTNDDIQNITHETKDRVTRTALKTGLYSGALLSKKKNKQTNKKHARSVPKVSTHNTTTIKFCLAINIATL